MNRITRFFHTPPDDDPGPPDVLRMISPSDRLERRETAPADAQSLLVIFGLMILYVAGGFSAIWLVACVITHAVRFALGL